MVNINFDTRLLASTDETISPLNQIALPYAGQFVRQISGLVPGLTLLDAGMALQSGHGIPGRAGTAFLMRDSTTAWLVTALHSLRASADPHNFTDQIESEGIIVRPPQGRMAGLTLSDGRKVRLVRKAGDIVDFVAVEIRPPELEPSWVALPSSAILGSEEAATAVSSARCWARRGQERLRLANERPALLAGFPGYRRWGADPVCIRVAAAPDVDCAVPWASAFIGDSAEGCSGGPVFVVESGRLKLAGLQATGNAALDNSGTALVGGTFVPLSIVAAAIADGTYPNGVSVFEC